MLVSMSTMRILRARGFTIVELLIVIVIIGVLAAIVMVVYSGVQNRARASAAQSALTQASKKISFWQVENQSVAPGSLSMVGVSNSTTTTYQYTPGDGGAYCLTATVKDVSYYISHPASGVPVSGVCSGHVANTGPGAQTNYANVVMADNPLAYYRLGESSGNSLVDSSGNGRHGTYEEGVNLAAGSLISGSENTAVGTTTGGAVYQPAQTWLWPQITVEAWIQTTASNSAMRVLSRWEGLSSSQRWIVLESRLEDKLRVAMHISGQGNEEVLEGSGLVYRDGQPHHLVATYDGQDQRLYFDGQLVAARANPGSMSTTAANTPLRIGRYGNNTSTRWQGSIDEVAMYDYALSAERIAAHYAAGTASN